MKSQNTLLNEMNEIVAIYHYYLALLNDEDALCLSSPQNSSKREATRFIARVFKSFITLDDEEKNMLNNEYFHRAESGWWTKKYEKETFVNLLLNSVSVFLRRFYEIKY